MINQVITEPLQQPWEAGMSPFANEKAETQRGPLTCPRSHSQQVAAMVEGSLLSPAESGLSLAGPGWQRERGPVHESGIPSCSQRTTNWFLSPYAFFVCSERV